MFDLLVSPFFDSQGGQIKVRFGGTLRVRPTLQTSRILRNLSISNVLRLNSIWANLHLISLGKAWGLETPFNVITGSRIHQGCVFRDLLPHQGTRTAYICYINPDFEPLAKEISTQILQDILKKRLQSLRNTSFEKMVWPCDSLKEQQNG